MVKRMKSRKKDPIANIKWKHILFKPVQYCRKDQQLLLGYYCQVVLEKGLLS